MILQPEMSAYEVTEALIEGIEANRFDAIILNFANPDMVGHSGMLEPTIKAIETVDECLGKIIEAIHAKGGMAIVTADHGNADEVTTTRRGSDDGTHDESGSSYRHEAGNRICVKAETLADLAPTMLKLLQVEQPAEMTGTPLF